MATQSAVFPPWAVTSALIADWSANRCAWSRSDVVMRRPAPEGAGFGVAAAMNTPRRLLASATTAIRSASSGSVVERDDGANPVVRQRLRGEPLLVIPRLLPGQVHVLLAGLDQD